MENWLKCIRSAEKTCFIQDDKKKVHYKFENGQEMAEEYNMSTQVLSKRAWKKKKSLTTRGEWEIEIGDPEFNHKQTLDNSGIFEAATSPMLSTRMTKNSIEWRIRNLPYPLDIYSVTADSKERCIVVRTSNKKFFKKIPVPDLDRLLLPLDQNKITVSHKFNTLIITYKKPIELINCERLVLEEINRIQSSSEGAMQCPTS